jgi:hypothetical protein
LVIKTLDPDLDPDPDSLEMLDPDPDSTDPNPQLWSAYLEQVLCSPPGEEEPLLVQVEDGGLQLPGAQIYDPEEVEPRAPIAHFQPLSHAIRSKD